MSNTCSACRDGMHLDFDFSMAFQPIVDLQRREVFAWEALVRGPGGEPAGSVLERVDDHNRYAFDQRCRIRAIELASALGLTDTGALLSINFLPNAVYRPETCIRATLATARRTGFPPDRLMFEMTEVEQVEDHAHLRAIADSYRDLGFVTAIDDFGAGYAGLHLLAEFQPDLLKLDMALTRNLHADPVRRALVGSLVDLCQKLGIRLLAEGVESQDELQHLRGLGVQLVQGYLFARPGFEQLPSPDWTQVPDSPEMTGVYALTRG